MRNLYIHFFIILAIGLSIHPSAPIITTKNTPVQYKPSRNHKRRPSKTRAPIKFPSESNNRINSSPKSRIANRMPEHTLQ